MNSMMSLVIWCVYSQNKLLLALPLTLLPLSFALVIGLDFKPLFFLCSPIKPDVDVPLMCPRHCCTCYSTERMACFTGSCTVPPPPHTHTRYVLIMGLIHRTWASHTLSFGPNHISGPSECLHITKPSSFPGSVCWSLFQHLTTVHKSRCLFWAGKCNMWAKTFCAGLSLSWLLQASCHTLLWVSVAPYLLLLIF